MGTNLNQSINSGIQGLCEAEYYEQSLEIELDPPCSRSNKRCQGPKCDLLSGDRRVELYLATAGNKDVREWKIFTHYIFQVLCRVGTFDCKFVENRFPCLQDFRQLSNKERR